MDKFYQDFRLAVRLALKDRGFAAATIATLALCLGANAAIFAIVNAVLLRPLPYPESDRLVTMFNAYPGAGATRGANAVPDYFDRLQEKDVFEHLAVYTWTSVTIGGQGTGSPERILGMTVTPSYFKILSARALRGRLFVESDTVIGQHHTVVLSQDLWQRLFPDREDLANTQLRINGEPFSVAGVMPTGFGLDPEVRLWMPAAFTAENRSDAQRHSNSWHMIGTLARGATLVQAQGHIDALNARNLERFPILKPLLIDAGFHTPVSLLQDEIVRDARPAILLIWGGVLLVLVIGCVNVANLASLRATARAREMATRLALGTTVRRLTQQTVTESLVLSIVGGGAGVLLAAWAVRAIAFLGIETLPRRNEITLDAAVLGYTFALVTLVGVVVGLWPAFAFRRTNLAQAIRDEGRSGTRSRHARTLRGLLVTSQVAFALVLLMAAGLLLASFQQVLEVDLGFQPDRVLTGDINLPASRYPRGPDFRAAADSILAELRRLPGVTAAGLTTSIPLGRDYSDSVIVAEGYQMAPGESLISPSLARISDGYLEAMGVSLVAGRFIDARDTFTAPRVIVVDERLAHRFWPDADPMGRRMYFPSSVENALAPPPQDEWMTVVGVVKDMRLQGIASNAGSGLFGTYFLPYRQSPEREVTLVLKTRQDPETLAGAARAAIARIDPELAFYDVRPMEALVDRDLTDRRTTMFLAIGFGAVALLLSAIGLYGVLAHEVRQRTREIAIRMALGANRAAVVGMVLRQGALVVAMGLLLGLGSSFLLRRAIESQLYEVAAMDPMVVTSVAVALSVVAICACALPACRAASTNPTTALADQ